jgi:hypothetical protein
VAAQATAAAVSAASAASAKVYADAQAKCGGKSDSVTQAKCNHTYIAQHLAAVPTATPVAAPRLADFQYSLKSPLWTPDLSGALLLGSLTAFALSLLLTLRRSRR